VTAAQPLAFVLLGMALPVVAAYLHRRKRRSKTVPSAILFRVIAGENVPTKRALASPRHIVSLVLILVALIALAIAIADLRPEAERPRDYIVVLDTSASMGATVPGSTDTRLDEAIDQLETAVERLGPGDRLALITSGDSTVVRIGLTEDHGKVIELAAAQEPAGSSTGMTQALRIADAMAGSRDGVVVLLSDGVRLSIPEMKHMPQHVPVGRPGPNVGINGLAVREADSLGLAEIYVMIGSDAGRERDGEIALMVDDKIVDVVPVAIPSTGKIEKLHRVALPEGERVVAKLQRHGEDVLAADDVADTARRVGNRLSVLLVARSRVSFTAEALRLHPRVDLRIVGPYDAVGQETYDLIVLESPYEAGPLPPAPRLLVLGGPPEQAGLVAAQRVTAPDVLRWSFDDPLFRFVDLSTLEVPRATTVEITEGVRALVDGEQGALAAAHTWEGRDVVYFGFAPHESDLVLRVGFVNLVANVVEWATPIGDPDDSAPPSVLPESETMLDPPPAVPGTVHGNFTDRSPSEQPLWRWLVWLAFGLVLGEGLLPWGKWAFDRLRPRLRPRRKGGAA
jgi:hypothetical protein